MGDRSSVIIKDLILPFSNIPKFQFTDQYNNSWGFDGAEVSNDIKDIFTCSYEDGQVLYSNVDKLLTVREQGALLMLALSSLFGAGDIEDVPKEAIEASQEIFQKKLYLAFTGRKQGSMNLLCGEWTSTVVFFEQETPTDGYLTARICDRPVVKKDNGKVIYKEGNVTQTKLPVKQGVAEVTDDGLLDPRTGFPFSVTNNSQQMEKFTRDIEDIIRKLAKDSPELAPLTTLPKNTTYYGVDMATYKILETQVGVPINTPAAKDALRLLRPGYLISHHNLEKELPLSNPMVMMIGRDERLGNPHNITFGNNNSPQCGISWRPIRLYKR